MAGRAPDVVEPLGDHLVHFLWRVFLTEVPGHHVVIDRPV
jgi:hypothetical protein